MCTFVYVVPCTSHSGRVTGSVYDHNHIRDRWTASSSGNT